MKKLNTFVAAIALSLSMGASAQPAPAEHHDHAHPVASATPATTAMTDGEVRKIDPAQGKLTLRHGPIAHLGMQGMTMVFRVADARLLEGLKVGDKLKFAVDKVQGALTVTAIEAAD